MSEVQPDSGLPRVLTMIREKLKELQTLVIRAAENAPDKVKAKAGGADMWLQSFSDRLTSVLEYNTDHLRGAKSKDVKDFDLLL